MSCTPRDDIHVTRSALARIGTPDNELDICRQPGPASQLTIRLNQALISQNLILCERTKYHQIPLLWQLFRYQALVAAEVKVGQQ
jgi:hypothetical protein